MPRTVAAPPQNDVYTAMLGLAVFGMTVSCLMLGLEVAGYDKEQPFQAVSLPKVEPRPSAPGGPAPAGTPPAPAGGSASTAPAVPPPTAPVFVPPVLTPPPAVAKVDPPKVEAPKIEDPNRGPRPGFNLAAPQPQRP